MKELNKINKEKDTMIFTNTLLLWILVSFSLAISLRIVAVSFISVESYRLLLVFIPLILTTLVSIFDLGKSYKQRRIINYSLISSIVIYLGSLLLLNDQAFKNGFIWVTITLFIIYSVYFWMFNSGQETDESESNDFPKGQKPFFMIYYLNFPKTYDFVTLINNKFKININNELNEEVSKSTNFDFGLNNFQTSTNARLNSSSSASKSERILENFEIKNTKSTHLQQILIHSKEVDDYTELVEGSLIKFSNVQLELNDQKENIEAIKLMLGGAFKGFNIKGQEEGMDFEMNLSSLIDSFLAECEYQLSFEHRKKSYYITIPLTGSDDFENDYTVNDLLTGKVSIIGVYKGDYERHTPFVNTLFNLNNSDNTETSIPTPVGGLSQSEYEDDELDDKDELDDNADGISKTDSSHSKKENTEADHDRIYIDVMAVIQEVSFNKEDNYNDD